MVGLEPTCPKARDFKSLVYTNFTTLALLLVPPERLELSSLTALASKTSVYTNSTKEAFKTWCPLSDSNGPPHDYKSSALPDELRGLKTLLT